MKIHFGSVFLAAVIGSTVCNYAAEPANETNSQAGIGTSSSNQVTGGNSGGGTQVSTPVLQPILTAWQEGHSSEAVDIFVHVNWSSRPVFPTGMVLGISEAEFKSLSDSDRQLRGSEMMTQLDLMKQLASAVFDAGQSAASAGNIERAKQCYGALKQFGAALNDPKALLLVKMVGQVSIKMADRGLANLGK